MDDALSDERIAELTSAMDQLALDNSLPPISQANAFRVRVAGTARALLAERQQLLDDGVILSPEASANLEEILANPRPAPGWFREAVRKREEEDAKDADRVRDQIDTLLAERDALRAERDALIKVTIPLAEYARHVLGREPNASGKDWACAMCAPGSEIVQAGYVCRRHKAADALTEYDAWKASKR